MAAHANLSDLEFERQIRECTFNPLEFTHEAHLRLAWININFYGINQAIINIQDQLYNFVKQAGAEDKYNKTLTIAAIKAVYHFKIKSSSENFDDFIAEFPQLLTDFRTLMLSHYSFNIYNSIRAKREYVEPDLAPF